jgi:outer membrane protein assembly factor BamB
MQVTALKLRDREFGDQWRNQIQDRWEYADFLEDSGWRKGWISFDCLCYDPPTDTVFCGITSFDADIFWGWSRRDREWVDPGYARVRDRYDAKFHRSLARNSRDGCLYAAPALLHDIDRFWEAPGARIVRYDPNTEELTTLGTPMAHVYIQAIVLDEGRQTIYGQTFTPEHLIAHDLTSGKSQWIGPTSSGMSMAQGENVILDDRGCVWGTWHVTRAWQSESGVDAHRLYRYDPERGRIDYLDRGLPRADGKYGYAQPEGFFNFGAGCLYVSGDGGALYRVDPDTGEAEFLFRAVGDEGRGRRSRLAAMSLGGDGRAYGVAGRDGECELLRFDPKDESYELLGPLKDESGVSAWQIHDVCVTTDGTVYAAENDHPHRSGYLWEVHL